MVYKIKLGNESLQASTVPSLFVHRGAEDFVNRRRPSWDYEREIEMLSEGAQISPCRFLQRSYSTAGRSVS